MLTKEDYIQLGRVARREGRVVRGGSSWQALAEQKGWALEDEAMRVAEEARKGKVFAEIMAMPVACAEPVDHHFIAVETEDGKRSFMKVSDSMMKRLQEELPKRPSERRREAHIQAMVAGYLEAMLWSSGGETDPDNEDETLEDLMAYDVADETTAKVQDICTRFYDANRTDLAAYADLKQHAPEHGPYECIGHDLWLTTAGHGAGFWDRGMGRVGDRLSAQCGYFKPFGHLDAYLGDDRLVYLS